MEFETNSSTPPQPQPTPCYIIQNPPRKRGLWGVIKGIFAAFAILINILLFLMVIGFFAAIMSGSRDFLTEEVIAEGPRTAKIAVINVEGIIMENTAREFSRQLRAAAKDASVRGLIVRVNSPGGAVSASDEIYNEINTFSKRTGKPVVGFMQSMAASGGYYSAVACDTLIAEPTAITGSIGVILGHFVFRELLQGKLGIEPVIIKSGEKKDWPSSFQTPTPEQIQYLQDKLITPAHERFVEVIAESRPALDIAKVKELADGSIFSAKEALDEKLIDEIGYLDDAVKAAKSLAGIENAQVVEYRKPFSLPGFLSSQGDSIFKIDRTALHEFNTPHLMYIWNPY